MHDGVIVFEKLRYIQSELHPSNQEADQRLHAQ